MSEKKVLRFWEIDFLRGIAVIMMIVFHFLFDLNYFGVYQTQIGSGFWWVFARATATIFIFLVGVSLALSYSRVRNLPSRRISAKYILRGLRIFIYGLLITLATWIFLENGTVFFGVLHFIGMAIILSRPFMDRKILNLTLGIAIICAGIYIQSLSISFPWLLWLGFKPVSFYTLDYFPLLPWLGVVLIGIFFGKVIYPEGKRLGKSSPAPARSSLIAPFCFLGKNSMVIYLLHQPVLIAVIYLAMI